MTTVDPAGAPFSFPAPRSGCPLGPAPAYTSARRERPVTRVTLWDGSSCWIVTRYADVRAVLRDNRFSADVTRPGFPFPSQARRAQIKAGPPLLSRMDNPAHGRLRGMLTADFTIRKMEALQRQIQQIVDDFLDRMIACGVPADLITACVLPVPTKVTCRLLGIDYAERDFYLERSTLMQRNDVTPQQMASARADLLHRFGQLTEAKRRVPDDGIISKLVAGNELDTAQVAAMGVLLFVGAVESVAYTAALSIVALLRDPGQLALLHAEPSLIDGAVEELLRYLSIINSGVPRAATEDVVIGSVTIRAGEGVLCLISTANRDEAVFPSGDRLDLIHNTRHHIAFGFGIHQCLGRSLARVQLRVILGTLFRRLPGLRLAIPFEKLRFRNDLAVNSLHELPVAW